MSKSTDLASRIEQAFTGATSSDAWAECFALDAVQHHPFFPAPNQGREAIRTAEGALFDAFSDIRMTAERVVDGSDGWAAFEMRVTATNTADIVMPDGGVVPATGKTVELAMASVLHIGDDGLITEEHRYQDNLAFMAQLGLT